MPSPSPSTLLRHRARESKSEAVLDPGSAKMLRECCFEAAGMARGGGGAAVATSAVVVTKRWWWWWW